MTVKRARWSLHFYALPYRREIIWANAVEGEGTFALLLIDGDNDKTWLIDAASSFIILWLCFSSRSQGSQPGSVWRSRRAKS